MIQFYTLIATFCLEIERLSTNPVINCSETRVLGGFGKARWLWRAMSRHTDLRKGLQTGMMLRRGDCDDIDLRVEGLFTVGKKQRIRQARKKVW